MGNESFDFLPADDDGPQPGPSWQRTGWSPLDMGGEDDFTAALDPMALKAAITAAVAKTGTPPGGLQQRWAKPRSRMRRAMPFARWC